MLLHASGTLHYTHTGPIATSHTELHNLCLQRAVDYNHSPNMLEVKGQYRQQHDAPPGNKSLSQHIQNNYFEKLAYASQINPDARH